jgi:tRNA-splicing ligase RtcB
MQVVQAGKLPVKVWVKDIGDVEPQAMEQLYRVSRLPFIHKWVASMPDVHMGKGAAVGSVIAAKGAIVPALVGVDIGCVDNETEFLSPTGWKKISEYSGEEVLVFNAETEETFFEIPPRYIKEEYREKFIHFKTKYGIDQCLTPDHRCLVYKYDRSYTFDKKETVSAQEIYDHHKNTKLGYRHRFLTSFKAPSREGMDITEAELRLMVMICADGSFSSRDQDSNRCIVKLRKDRKIQRIKTLLKNAGVDYKEGTADEGLTTVFTFYPPIREKCLKYFYGCSSSQLEVICNEVFHWDGNKDEKCFYSRNKESADFMNYAFTVCGYRSTIQLDYRESGIDYRVFAFDNIKVGINGTPKTEMKLVDGDGYKYCFTTSTSYWIMRRNGNIAVTGNCGMLAAKLNIKASDLPNSLSQLRLAIESRVPVGHGCHNYARNPHLDPKDLSVYDELKSEVLGRIGTQIGTLGGGNHFIEICLDENQDVWIMLHSGSRNIGKEVAEKHISKAKDLMKQMFIHLEDPELAYFGQSLPEYQNYLNDVLWCQTWAKNNRLKMFDEVLAVMQKYLVGKNVKVDGAVTSCHHNYVSVENHYGENVIVTRKGAVSAKDGEMGIIPGSMGTKSYIVRGKGNPESFCSCSHGAGRRMSRSEAKRVFTLDDLKSQTEGVECRKDQGAIDEIPGAYKSIDEVMDNQKDLVEIVHTLKQVLCIKG